MDQDRPGWNPPATNAAPHAEIPLGAPTEVVSGPRRSRVGTGIAVAAVGIGVLGLVGTAYAASGSPTPTPSGSGSTSTAPGQQSPGLPGDKDGDRRGPMGGHMGGGPGGFGMRGAGMGIHGSFVVPKQGGGYQTVHTQRGSVTAVSTTSITVTSEDGYSQEYTVTADTVVNAQRDGIDSIKTGDTVSIIGIADGDTVTAVHIMDGTRIKAGLAPLAPAQPKPAPSSSASGTA